MGHENIDIGSFLEGWAYNVAMTSAQEQVYLNGRFVPRGEARVDVEDRGYMFADGVYELTRYHGGCGYQVQAHLARLRHSLEAIRIAWDARLDDLPAISTQLLSRNGWSDANVYWQVTRGAARRDRRFPAQVVPGVLVMGWPVGRLVASEQALLPPMLRAITLPDRRWLRCGVKAVMLLDSVLARQAAEDAGAGEAIFHRDASVTEGTSTNVFIVRGGVIHTRPCDNLILPGITRARVIELARQAGMSIIEKPFDLDDLRSADEVFVTGTTTLVTAVTHVDDQPVGDAQPGLVTRALYGRLIADMHLSVAGASHDPAAANPAGTAGPATTR